MSSPHSISMSSRRSGGSGGICKTCIDITKWLPVLFIVSVISWSYYAFVIQLCFLTMEEDWLKAITLIVYHTVLILFLWSYWQTVFTNPQRIPKEFKIPSAQMDRIDSAGSENEINDILEHIVHTNHLPILTRTHIRQIRYCEKCSIIKPDRCHHCSVCGTCVLKMDHHCPWVNNCVSFNNYKYFVLFLIYAFLYCFVIFSFTMKYFIEFWSGDWAGQMGGKFHILFVFFVAAMFAVSLVSLFGYHCFLISRNRSTLESFRSPIFSTGPQRKGFSLGTNRNFIEVFGENQWKWCLPVFTSMGDGLKFPTADSREYHERWNYNSIANTDTTSASGSPTTDNEGRFTGVTVDKYPVNQEITSAVNNGPANLNLQTTVSTTEDEDSSNHNTTSTEIVVEQKEMPLVYF